MKQTRRLGWLAAGLLCVAAARSACASDLAWKFSSSLDYASGDYGTGTRSSSLYIPFTLKRYWNDWNASLTVPFLSQSSNGQVTNVGGKPGRIGRGSVSTDATTHSGLGDLLVRGGYDILKEDPQPFDLSLVGKVKFPTADKDKGLGTGEFDGGFGLESGKLIAPGWTLLADLYFTVIGSPPGLDLRNQAAADIGVSRLLIKELTLTALLEGSNALVSGEPAPFDLRGILDYRLNEQGGLFIGALAGLSDGSPDYGLSFGGSYRF